MLAVEFKIEGKKAGRQRVVKCSLPATYDDLTPDDILLLCGNLDKGHTIFEFKFLLFKKYVSLTAADIKTLYEERTQLAEIFRHMKIDLFEAKSTKNMVPEFVFNGQNYVGHIGDFSDVTFDQFAKAEDMLNMFYETQNENCLLLMLECLYHLPEENCNISKINQHKPKFKGIDRIILMAATISYTATSRALRSHFKNIFPEKIADEKESSMRQDYDYSYFNRLQIDLAGPKFGNLVETQNTKVFYILQYINQNTDDKTGAL